MSTAGTSIVKNTIVAALPLGIALASTVPLGTTPDARNTRTRPVPSALSRTFDMAQLDDTHRQWLAEHNPLGMPTTTIPASRTLVVREGYTLAHNNQDLVADWVAFHLTADYARGTEKRPGTSAFRPDPALPSGRRAELEDYRGWNGVYDRGHQCASGDSKGRGTRVIRESFVLSNMTPQASRLNQHKWRLLEQRIQQLAIAHGELWVITGPVFWDGDEDGYVTYSVIGPDEVAVPTHYFKIVYERAPGGAGWRALAFLVPNETLDGDFEDYLVSIDEIEELTGWDFLAELPDEEEGALEASLAGAVWMPS